jgi:ankyrin repeat protein
MHMDSTQFFNQIRNGDVEGVRQSLKTNPGLLQSRDPRGSTPLILAAYYNHLEVVRLLLEQGAPVNETDGSGNTALMGVCFKGYAEMASLLIEAGADVNVRNGMGGTCLIFSVTFNRPEITRLLVKAGADPSARDAQGKTALDHARDQGLADLVPLLETTQ